MKGLRPFLIVSALFLPLEIANAVDFSSGITAFEQQHWSEAMTDFLDVLKQDPGNPQVHQYINLVVRELDLQRRAEVQEERLKMLSAASQGVPDAKGASLVREALSNAADGGARTQTDKWHAQCEEARMQLQLGHVLPANDIILQILAENPSHVEAQQELSDIQTKLHKELDSPQNLSALDRYVYEGFYAYGQSDYFTAYTAWGKARAIASQNTAPEQLPKTIQELRFGAYEKIAEEHVDEQKRAADLQNSFEHAVALYKAGHYSESLEAFRRLAVQEPEYPQLGFYLVQSEGAAEKDRTRRLGEAKREQIAQLIEKGVKYLETEKYDSAEKTFKEILSIDPTHPQARSYLAMTQAESSRLHDPKAAQMHYEAGLIAYASGKLDEAVREWRVATHMDPQNQKAANALTKVQRELAMSNDVP